MSVFAIGLAQMTDEMRMERKQIIHHFSQYISMLKYNLMANKEATEEEMDNMIKGIRFD